MEARPTPVSFGAFLKTLHSHGVSEQKARKATCHHRRHYRCYRQQAKSAMLVTLAPHLSFR